MVHARAGWALHNKADLHCAIRDFAITIARAFLRRLQWVAFVCCFCCGEVLAFCVRLVFGVLVTGRRGV